VDKNLNFEQNPDNLDSLFWSTSNVDYCNYF